MEENQGFDMESAVNDLASDLTEDFAPSEPQDDVDNLVDNHEPELPVETQEVEVRAAPKSWPAEMHQHWSKTPKEVQDYWDTREKQMLDGLEQYKTDSTFGKSIRDVLNPYMARINAVNMQPAQVIQTLLNADHILSSGSASQKQEYFAQLAKSYGIDLPSGQSQPQDTVIQKLQDEISQLRSGFQSAQDATYKQEYARVSSELDKFAQDPAHPYFDEVAADIVPMLQAGHSLKDAYEKAVWANPVTRQKELDRVQTERDKELKDKAVAEAEAKKKAASLNIRSRDTQRTPTEKNRATMRDLDSVMADVMTEIRQSG